jgi:hypothetical protein
MWHHDRALLISSWYGVPPVRRSPRCAWGWGVAWDAGLPHKTLLQPPNAGTAEPFRVSPPEAVAYPLVLLEKASPERLRQEFFQSFQLFVRAGERRGIVGIEVLMELYGEQEKQLHDLVLLFHRFRVEPAQEASSNKGTDMYGLINFRAKRGRVIFQIPDIRA